MPVAQIVKSVGETFSTGFYLTIVGSCTPDSTKVLQLVSGLDKFSPAEDIFDFYRLRDENLDMQI